jgi:hypothetical protein
MRYYHQGIVKKSIANPIVILYNIFMPLTDSESSPFQLQETERVEPTLRPLDLYTLYRIYHQPDQIHSFAHLVATTAESEEYAETMAPVWAATKRHLNKFGVELSTDAFQLARAIFNKRLDIGRLPSPDSIPVADLTDAWSRIQTDGDVISVDYSLNGLWNASGDQNGATMLQHLHMFSTGSRDTRHRVFTPNWGNAARELFNEFNGDVSAKGLSSEVRKQIGEHFDLKHLLTRNPEIFWGLHGYAGNIDAFSPLFRSWIKMAQHEGRSPFTCIAMEGLGANGTRAEQVYREIYHIEPHQTTIPRYGQQMYEAFLNSGTAGITGLKKRYVGYSMGGAGLTVAKEMMISDEEQIRESYAVEVARKRYKEGKDIAVQKEERGNWELKQGEPLTFYPDSSFFHFNPVYPDVTIMAGSYPPDAPLTLRAQAVGSNALTHLAMFAGRNHLNSIPGVNELIRAGTHLLMGGRGEQIGHSVRSHGKSLVEDHDAVTMQEAGIRAFKGLSPGQLARIHQDNASSWVLIGTKDRITHPELQEKAIKGEVQAMMKERDCVPPQVLKVPTGHGLPYDEFMQAGYNLLAVLGDLDKEGRDVIGRNSVYIQAAINGTIQVELLHEISDAALRQVSEVQDGSEYPALINAKPRLMKSAHFRAQYVTELINLIRKRYSNSR